MTLLQEPERAKRRIPMMIQAWLALIRVGGIVVNAAPYLIRVGPVELLAHQAS